MQGMAERGHVDDECLRAIGDTFGWPGQPGCFPRWKQKQYFRIGGLRGRPEQQRDDFGFAVELRIQFGVPCGFGLQGEGDRKLSGHRAVTPAFSEAIHIVRSPFHFFARTSSANLQSRSAVNARKPAKADATKENRRSAELVDQQSQRRHLVILTDEQRGLVGRALA